MNYQKTVILLIICLLTQLNVRGQFSLGLNLELDNQSEPVNDFFGSGREVKVEHRASIIFQKQFDRVGLGINYSFNYGRIIPELYSGIGIPQNEKTYNRIGICGDFEFSRGRVRPYIFNNTGVILDYPKELESYRRANETSINSQIGLGLRVDIFEHWNLGLQYSVGQVLGLKSFKIYENIGLIGLTARYRFGENFLTAKHKRDL